LGKNFDDDVEVQEEVMTWFKVQAADFYDSGIQKLVSRIHEQIVAVCGNVMNRQNLTKWCREFSEGRTDVHDEQRCGRPSLISDDLLHGN